ncbi:MAG: hypothetical protein K8T20_15545 [Planctomycetes bacterium]|nr:hypothetical protein [Planctomycetota bacterium]
MDSDPAKPGMMSNPLLAAFIGVCSLGLLGYGAWQELSVNGDQWAFWIDVVLGVGGVLFALDVLVFHRKR